LYEIVKSLDFKKLIDFDIADLRLRLAVPPTQYSNYKDFRRRVLEPAIKDINEFTDLDISLHEKRGQYNKVEKVYFTVKKKKVPKLAERVAQGEMIPPLSDEEQGRLISALLGKEGQELPEELEQLPGQLAFEGDEEK
jgi:plasmid replication initiation protein